MDEHAPDYSANNASATREWSAALLTMLRYVSWGLFVYSTPGMLLVVLLVTAWLVPGVVVLLVLAVLQVPAYLLVRRLLHPQDRRLGREPAPSVDPRFAADYWSGSRPADFGSSRNT